MTIPDYESIMLPLLETLGHYDGGSIPAYQSSRLTGPATTNWAPTLVWFRTLS